MNISLDNAMSAFRLASRDLFNNHFYNSYLDPFLLRETYADLQVLLFQKMVEDPFSLDQVGYGEVHRDILVRNRLDSDTPAMINRDIDSGYWDYPVKSIPSDVVMCFISFFDFDETRGMESMYVLVEIDCWSEQKDVEGKRALIEFQHVFFESIKGSSALE
ncbi:MAG: hypothetical protein R3C24_17010 [Cyanobacteriota/Melainabacteria group bacterium]|nr:hypothetical protein [Cyanobacteria bacterium HKST-UBA01]